MRLCARILFGLVIALGVSTLPAAMLAKTFVFKSGATLDVGEPIDEGLRLDTIRFALPDLIEGKLARTSGLPEASVAISNIGTVSRKLGVALALFDDDNRLLGVASGGIKMFPLKPGRQATFVLVFQDVNGEIHKATKFQISIEPRP